MPRPMTIVKKAGPALHSAPIPGAGGIRKPKNTTSTNTTVFRLLKVPKYAKRTAANLYEKKNDALAEEVNRLKQGWMQQETEIERLRKELERARRELEAIKERDTYGQSVRVSRSEEEDFEALWACYGK